jgi:surfeit locus 1 family protein
MSIDIRRFRPTLWPTLFTIPAVVVMLSLSAWQFQRLAWKTDLIETFEARVAQEAVAVTPRIDDLEAWRFRRVTATGTYDYDREIQLTGRPFEGTAGFHVVTPLRTTEGFTVLVNRGWVPERDRRPADRPETLPAGEVTVVGIVRRDALRGYFVPDNEPEHDVWLYIDIAEIAAARNIEGPVANYVVDELRPDGPYRLPIGAKSKIDVRNEHLSYAITWLLLAATLIVVYVIYHSRTDDGPGSTS